MPPVTEDELTRFAMVSGRRHSPVPGRAAPAPSCGVRPRVCGRGGGRWWEEGWLSCSRSGAQAFYSDVGDGKLTLGKVTQLADSVAGKGMIPRAKLQVPAPSPPYATRVPCGRRDCGGGRWGWADGAAPQRIVSAASSGQSFDFAKVLRQIADCIEVTSTPTRLSPSGVPAMSATALAPRGWVHRLLAQHPLLPHQTPIRALAPQR